MVLITLFLLFVGLFGLCWGSFLNVLAYRLAFDKKFFTMRSRCPSCDHVIAWYDNIPLISWFLLRGRCRNCRGRISPVYPLFEFLMAGIMMLLVLHFLPRFSWNYYLLTIDPFSEDILNFFSGIPQDILVRNTGALAAFFLFFSALLAASIADLRAMVIPQLFSLWLAPVGIVLASLGLTGISWKMSLLGAILGYGVLWLTATIFKLVTKKDGLGAGDMELLCMIGAFLGPVGVWFALMFGSLFGLVIGSCYLLSTKQGRMTRIPFGPFLSFGAIAYFFLQQTLVGLFI